MSLLILGKIWSEKLKNGPKITKKVVEEGGKGARATAIRPLTRNPMATHPKIPHGHSPPNLGARRTPIRPLLRKIEEKAREEHL